jgi:hypothetical protein
MRKSCGFGRKKMPIKLQGKEYKLVSERLVKFHEEFGDNHVIQTNVLPATDSVIVKAQVVDRNSGDVVATGHAQNFYHGKSKELEKTETTAIGRALAVFHPDLMGTEIASADEIVSWQQQQNDEQLLKHMEAVREHWRSIEFLKRTLEDAETMPEQSELRLGRALEAWRELGEDVMRVLWRAPSKGGIFTTLERKLLDEASALDHAARKGNADHN